jgi:hypothetical protein
MKFASLFAALGLLLSSCGKPSVSKALDEDVMGSFVINGFELSGAEYWPFVGSINFNYPDDVLWGFYPDAATEPAIACAKVSWDALKTFLGSNPIKMQQVVALGATKRFYLWTNDYTRADEGRTRRKNAMWHWNSGEPNYALGYWKWEALVTQDGECLIPDAAQVEETLDKAIVEIEANSL